METVETVPLSAGDRATGRSQSRSPRRRRPWQTHHPSPRQARASPSCFRSRCSRCPFGRRCRRPGRMVAQFDPVGPADQASHERAGSRFEWRTPPLWGFRDSAPYLHDGRAQTLDQAIAFHGGEATAIAQSFFRLTHRERRQLEAFLKSLTAPTAAELVASATK